MIRYIILVLNIVLYLAAATPAHAAWQEDGTVVAVTGADTLAVRFPGTTAPTRVRLIGVGLPPASCQNAATATLTALTLGKVVTVEFARNGVLHDADGLVRATVWRGLDLYETESVNDIVRAQCPQAGGYSPPAPAPRWSLALVRTS